ncbi:Rrf2 family transcriptional regulator [Pelagicoccus sp. NFK12]|uniref:Rrf2 family transcriptional regulator n=1 Tax=Pelagicoccus enzymogenes TaxID=2773457 RepID=A0A927FAZ4_9BACT|nr:Rrf2 family transcriptional regulator [Pelagicoccus enzymogenes]MBD5781031.1 Rrf2 family transcriptional regulator [Pelagicoccus enzymogenes]
MKLPKKAEYGLRAMIDLGIAHSLDHDRVPLSTLAEAENLPTKFLEQIFLQLRKDGFVKTQRGKAGGYYIARDISTIKVGELVRALDGPLAPISCASQSAYERCSCPDEEHCGLRMIMIDVRNAVSNILDRYSLKDVVEVTLRKIRRTGADNYFLRMSQNAGQRPAPANPSDPRDGFLAELAGELSTPTTKSHPPTK